MKKRILSILLICCMMLMTMPMTASAKTGIAYCRTCKGDRTFDISYVSIGDKQHSRRGICQTCKNPASIYLATHKGTGTATCTTGIICDDCGAEFGVLGHELGEWQQGGGKHWKECSRCKAKVEEGPHNGSWEIEKNETLHWQVCTVCRYKTYERPHNWLNPYVRRKEPTCTAAGYIEYTCDTCNLEKKETLNALGHDYVHHEAQAPTCTGIGWDAYDTCSRCDYTTYVEIPASGHSFGEWAEVTSATCTDKGSEKRTCTVCQAVETRDVNPNGHSWESEYTIDKKETCETDGSKSIHCSKCDAVKDRETITATGHSLGDWETVTPSTCTDKGSEKRTCTVCQAVETRDLDPNGHSWESDYTIDKEETCETEGSKSIHCSKCDAVKDSQTLSALGHDYGSSVTKAATCTEYGVKTYLCKNDSSHTYTESVPANGHDLVYHEAQAATAAEFGNIAYWRCDDCGKYFSDEACTKEIKEADTVAPKLAPSIIAGKNQAVTQGENQALSFTSDGAFDDFIRVELDGKTLAGKYDTDKAGGILVTLNSDYVATLSPGEHTLGIVSQSGTATATFTVTSKPADTNPATETPKTEDNSPQTDGNNHMTLWIAALFVVCAGCAGAIVLGKKKNNK